MRDDRSEYSRLAEDIGVRLASVFIDLMKVIFGWIWRAKTVKWLLLIIMNFILRFAFEETIVQISGLLNPENLICTQQYSLFNCGTSEKPIC